ncbi:peptidoglycan DD-metalloendopeptidase family protein [Sulfurovum sp.]|uniref:murein hydrolase activator EnvC family protein n=1 Tax=Sulfurovum sp. TaxID=1969726 RepID=UPI0025FF3786|nr:peptidoglycan DD-metalloendopeptidase family protein [Sulfurovum sp.]
MRSFIFSCFVVIGLLQGATTVTKIKDSRKNLSSTVLKKKQASRQLEKIAKDIRAAEKDIAYLEKKIEELGRDQNKTEEEYKALKQELKKSKEDFENTNRQLKRKHKAFISLLSEQFSVIFAMEQAHEPTRKSIIAQEVYKAYKKHNAKVLATLRSEIITLKKRKEDKLYLHNKTKNRIKRIIKKRESYAQKKLAKKKLLEKLAKDEEKYNAILEKIVDKQNSLRATLAKLNILHKQEVEEARKQAEARKKAIRLERERKKRLRKAKALARAKARKAKEALRKAKTKEARKKARLAAKEAEKERKRVYKESEKVRNINSSYHKSKVYAYRGGKTISPIPGARLIKKFGTYVDPIYKIKIFNESITLKAPSSNAKVKNVLNGKVVFAGNSSMLGKVVVVAHSGKIHTVYAGLSKIAPTIRVGSKIRKGYVVGKVASKLMFQATKNSKHINPLKLIQI